MVCYFNHRCLSEVPGILAILAMIKRLIWSILGALYVHVIKPIIFRMSPDGVHEGMINSMHFLGKSTIFLGLTKLVFKRPPSSSLRQTINGIKFDSPVGLSAGMDKNGEIVPVIASLGFGFSEVGSVTAMQSDGNPRPWFYRLPKSKSLVVNAGLANQGSDVVISRLESYSGSLSNFPVILSIAKTNSCDVVSVEEGVEDYIVSLKRAKGKKSIDIVELNISCPNVHGGEPFTSPDKLELLLTASDKLKLKQPVYIKMPIDLSWRENKELLDVIIRHQVAGVTIANLAKDRSKVDLDDTLPDDVLGNLSGEPTRSRSNELIEKTFLYCGDRLTIIGVGGIFSAQDAYEKIRLGASLVEFITGMIFYGPQLASQINDGILASLRRDGFDHISKAIGSGVKE